MEGWQKRHIEKNLVELIKSTFCTIQLMSKLREKKILSRDDEESLELPHLTPMNKSKQLYTVLQTREASYKILVQALEETRQTAAAKILKNHHPIFQNCKGITYDRNQLLGTGCLGTKVFRGTVSGREVAVKVLIVDMVDLTKVQEEIEFLKKLDSHENIVRYFNTEVTDNLIYIALELFLISLQDEVKAQMLKIPNTIILEKCTKGIAFLHSKNVIHRDLKPANILLSNNNQVKLSDFGLSKQIPLGASRVSVGSVFVGTADWVAPEVLLSTQTDLGQNQHLKMSTSSDIFSLGCVYFFVLTQGEHAFGGPLHRQHYIVTNKPMITESGVDQFWLDLIATMIDGSPESRPSAEFILSSDCFQLSSRVLPSHKGRTILRMPTDLVPENATQISNEMIATTPSKMAMEYYICEMDKYLENCPNATPEEITVHHNNVSLNAISLTEGVGGGSMTLERSAEYSVLFKSLYGAQAAYQFRAEINTKSFTHPFSIGIDLGNNMSCVMAYYKGRVVLVPNHRYDRLTPSCVAYHEDKSETFGQEAKNRAYRCPKGTIFDLHKMIGLKWNDEKLQEDMKRWPFEVVNDNNNVKVKTWGKKRFPYEITAGILSMFRIMADEHLHLSLGTVTKAVITVPAYFTKPQRRATRKAGELAGLEVLEILDKPFAAAIAYSWESKRFVTQEDCKILVYDLEDDRVEVTAVQVRKNSVDILAFDGLSDFGDKNFENVLVNYCLNEFLLAEGVNLMKNLMSDHTDTRDDAKRKFDRLQHCCVSVIEELMSTKTAAVSLDTFNSNIDFQVEMTRAKLEELVKPVVEKTMNVVKKVIENVKGKSISGKEDIDNVILVGKPNKLWLVEKALTEYFEGKPIHKHINPEEVVAYGAAIQAAILNKEK